MSTHLAKITVDNVSDRYRQVREQSLLLIADLRPEDTVVQTMSDVSPTKWHLAHVTWFFEHFVLQANVPHYTPFNDAFDYLFNSYYVTAGQMHARPKRGHLSRPTLSEVLEYRSYVDTGIQQLLQTPAATDEVIDLVTLGLNHEQQHQELLLTDIKHVFSNNPLQPAASLSLATPTRCSVAAYSFSDGESGIHPIGAEGAGFDAEYFAFDNETPRHGALLHEHQIGNRLITNGEYREFIRDRAYENPALWLSDGWSAIHKKHWQRPLYWSEDLTSEFTLGGLRDIDDSAPVCHVSYYEADAFSRWAGARLPTEFEWERAATRQTVRGNLMESKKWHPEASAGTQLYGDVWEWTSSPYAPYPGFVPLAGSLGEYNGKFMCNQVTVRGGSCVTATNHIRASYRSFFYADARWQFLGLRLAKDGHGI